MNTEDLVRLTQHELTKAMMLRSAPSGGLPLGFRGIMMSLGEMTIMKGKPFETVPAMRIIGDTIANYYIAGDGTLGGDIASLSDEPFPLITPYRNYSKKDEKTSNLDKVTTFKHRMTGGHTSPRYMMVQLSELGYEYLKNMEYFPKTYDIYNTRKVGINIKSHVPVELLRTTTFRTQGKGADMYPMNPSELFYTMYEMMEYGCDIPVERLTKFKGFDLGDANLSIHMKPEALHSLFNIGICAFSTRIDFDVSFQGRSIVFKAFPYKLTGKTFTRQVENIIKRNKGQFQTFEVKPENISSHIIKGKSVALNNVQFKSWDEDLVRREVETVFFKQVFANYHHFAHDVNIEIEDELEKVYELDSKSVRETLIQCIENYKEITRTKYLGEIEKIRSKIKELMIYEKVTRPYVAKLVQELMLEDNYTRSKELKRQLDEYHNSDPEQYPLITQEEVDDYIWVNYGNDVLANLNARGHTDYERLIKDEMDRIAYLENQAREENIIEEAKSLFYNLSQNPDYQRISPVYFINSTLDVSTRERVADFVNIYQHSDIRGKVHYYGPNGILKTSGKNLPKDTIPYYTIYNKDLTFQEGDFLYKLNLDRVPKLGSNLGFISGDIKLAVPHDKAGIYLTNTGRLGVFHKVYAMNRSDGEGFMHGEHVVDFIPINPYININTLETTQEGVKVVIVRDTHYEVIDLDRILEEYVNLGMLKSIEYKDVRAIELLEDEKELSKVYIWAYDDQSYVRLSDIDVYSMTNDFNKAYYPNHLVSGNKQAYLDGIHIPTNILEELAGVELATRNFDYDYNLPEGIEKYIVHVSSNPQENSKEKMKELATLIDSKVKDLTDQGGLSDSSPTRKLAVFNFIREIE